MKDWNQMTGFEKLQVTFGLKNDPRSILSSSQENSKPEVIKSSDPIQFKREVEEQRQQQVLTGKFLRVARDTVHQALSIESTRVQAYFDFESMEYYPLIASALDLIAEEATTSGDDGKILHIYSNNHRIKKILEDLLYGRLDVNGNLYSWTRNLIKFGDNFVYLLLDKKDGVKVAHQLVNFNIERKEEIKNDKYSITFRNKFDGHEYNAFEIAHFRLLGNDQYLPYGSSMLNKIRRTVRMLVMAEDAMLSYRLIRGADRRIIKVNVGNINDDDVLPYMAKVAAQFKKSPFADASGNLSYKFNLVDYSEDIFIPQRNGENGTVVETLNGASNLDSINDISYLRDNLFTGLGIPKSFLNYIGDKGEGDGKNMAMLDVRFAKKVNRIQQALVQELNKICMIHLFLLGFEDEITNFRLSLTNPSVQADLLKIEMLKEKSAVYKDITTPNEGGIAAWSVTKAKKEIFNMSDDQIIDDLKQQFFEKVVVGEITGANTSIKSSTIFDDLIERYGLNQSTPPTDNTETPGLPGTETPPSNTGETTPPENSGTPVNPQELKEIDGLFVKSKVLTEEMNLLFKSLDELDEKGKNIRST
jgi:hypothetical protein